MLTNYPSKEEIINNTLEVPLTYYDIVKTWKEDYYSKKWPTLYIKDKIQALIVLIDFILEPPISITFGHFYACNLEHRIIKLDIKNPSILSTLHEVGHLIYGPEELLACSFSYNLFKEIFPNELKKLVWNNHMLVKNK